MALQQGCGGLELDVYATSEDECRESCCLDPTCIVFQYGPPVDGAGCCGSGCWRGRADSCDGGLLNGTVVGARKASMPFTDSQFDANATASKKQGTEFGQEELILVWVSGIVLLCVFFLGGWYYLHRRHSNRAVFPHTKTPAVLPPTAKQPASKPHSAGDMIDAKAVWAAPAPTARRPSRSLSASLSRCQVHDISSQVHDISDTGFDELTDVGAPKVASKPPTDGVGEASTQLADFEPTHVDLDSLEELMDANEPYPGELAAEENDPASPRSPSRSSARGDEMGGATLGCDVILTSLSSVTLVDDMMGGFWACARQGSPGSHASQSRPPEPGGASQTGSADRAPSESPREAGADFDFDEGMLQARASSALHEDENGLFSDSGDGVADEMALYDLEPDELALNHPSDEDRDNAPQPGLLSVPSADAETASDAGSAHSHTRASPHDVVEDAPAPADDAPESS